MRNQLKVGETPSSVDSIFFWFRSAKSILNLFTMMAWPHGRCGLQLDRLFADICRAWERMILCNLRLPSICLVPCACVNVHRIPQGPKGRQAAGEGNPAFWTRCSAASSNWSPPPNGARPGTPFVFYADRGTGGTLTTDEISTHWWVNHGKAVAKCESNSWLPAYSHV